jgi:hypothetical protein
MATDFDTSKKTPKGTRPRGNNGNPHQVQPGRNRPAKHFDAATKTWHQPKRLTSKWHANRLAE